MRRLAFLTALLIAVTAFAVACGGSKHPAAPTTTTAATAMTKPAAPATTTSTSTSGPSALQAEANASAAGDIPDNQVFLVYANHRAGYSMKYPEGWARQGSVRRVTFRDKNNIVRVVVVPGAAPTLASVHADVAHLGNARIQSAPHEMTLSGRPAYKVVYTTVSAPNPVTGKRVTLIVDRYYVWKNGRRAVVDLGTPQGVDNVDAYRMMIESFRWS
jgi:hypothetical protein